MISKSFQIISVVLTMAFLLGSIVHAGGSGSSTIRSFSHGGRNFTNYATISVDRFGVVARTFKNHSANLPAGSMGARAFIVQSNGVAVGSSNWGYSGSNTSSIGVTHSLLVPSVQLGRSYYAYGNTAVRLTPAIAYTTFATFTTPTYTVS